MKTARSDYPVKQLYENTYLTDDFGCSSMYVLTGTKSALVVDCGTGIGDFLSCVRSVTDLPFEVALTHVHPDHAGGIRQFDRVYVPEKDIKRLRFCTSSMYRKLVFRVSKSTLIKRRECVFNLGKKQPEIIPLRDKDVFDLGGRKITVIENAGHTLGSVSFFDEKYGVLISGDNYNACLLLWLGHAASVEKYVGEAERVLNEVPFEKLVCSHTCEVFDKEAALPTLECAKEILAERSKNTIFKHIKVKRHYDCNGKLVSGIIYRTDNVFEK